VQVILRHVLVRVVMLLRQGLEDIVVVPIRCWRQQILREMVQNVHGFVRIGPRPDIFAAQQRRITWVLAHAGGHDRIVLAVRSAFWNEIMKFEVCQGRERTGNDIGF
jgi:hypothetical protein